MVDAVEATRATAEAWPAVEAPDSLTSVAWVDRRPAGLTAVAPAFHDPQAGGIYRVWVLPDARARRVGDALLDAALIAAADLGHRRVLLDVGDHNVAAQRLYARAGLTRTGRIGALPPLREHVTEHELGRDLDGRTSAGAARPVEG